jgi:hypothetical protein
VVNLEPGDRELLVFIFGLLPVEDVKIKLAVELRPLFDKHFIGFENL